MIAGPLGTPSGSIAINGWRFAGCRNALDLTCRADVKLNGRVSLCRHNGTTTMILEHFISENNMTTS
jgi:hypothetical protein